MYLALVILLTLLSALLHYLNLSPFKFYPDAYQNLIVAKNIADYHSVVGYLGPDGIPYPYFFMWTRPVYALFINFFQLFNLSAANAAVLVSYLAGVLTVPLAYFLTKFIFNSQKISIAASLLTAISFNLAVWSGFIYTEAIAVFFTLSFLTALFATLTKKAKLADWPDLITGSLLAICFFTRYEYVVLLIPTLFIILTSSPTAKNKIINILIGSFFVSTLFITQLYPWQEIIPIALSQSEKLIKIGLLTLLIVLTPLLLIKSKIPLTVTPSRYGHRYLNPYTFSVVVIVCLSLLILLKLLIPNLPDFLSAPAKFFKGDFLLFFLFILGLIKLLENNLKIAFFSLLAIFLLAPIYYNINPEMERYWTHLFPFILIPASFALSKFFDKPFLNSKFKILNSSSLILIPFLFLLILQTQRTYNGIKDWNNGEWHKVSYEQKSAQLLSTNQQLLSNNPILLVSMPEPYYFYTNISTQSITDYPPYIYLPQTLNNRDLLIIQDIGMSDLFPNFNNIIDKNLPQNKVAEYFVGETYHFAIKKINETEPVKVYRVTVGELKRLIFNF